MLTTSGDSLAFKIGSGILLRQFGLYSRILMIFEISEVAVKRGFELINGAHIVRFDQCKGPNAFGLVILKD